MMRFRKPELIPLLFIVGAELLLLGLGFWQFERMQWKNMLVTKIEQVQQMPALGSLPQNTDGLEYRNVVLTGTFINDKALRLIGAPHDGMNGFLIVTPFTLEDDGRIILVHRGFSPEGKESK